MGILEPKFASGIARAAGLRNRIVHEYDEIEPEKVFEAIRSAIADLPGGRRTKGHRPTVSTGWR